MKPVDGFLSPADGASQRYEVRRISAGVEDEAIDDVAEEVPVSLEFNGVSYAVMLASPGDLEDFALGFALSEGIIAQASELFDLETSSSVQGITIHARIASERFVALKERRRALAGRTGCGLCGVESLAQVVRPTGPVAGTAKVRAQALLQAFARLRDDQPLMSLTGAVHAASWLSPQGELKWLREDVGRHNALDKLLGAAAAAREDLSAGAVLVTSRASFEMVQKCAALGVPLLAAISAPTGLAIRTAQSVGMTLVGFARSKSLSCYAHPERILHETGGAP